MWVTMPMGIPGFEDRPLLDVEFDEGVVVSGWQAHRLERTRVPGARPKLVERAALGVAQRPRLLDRDRAGHEPAPQAAEPETGRLLRREHDHLEGAPRRKTRPLESCQRLEGPQHADDAVVPARIRYRVRMRARGDRGKGGLASLPPCEEVADRVLPDREAGLACGAPHIVPTPEVGLGKKHPRDHRRGSLRNQGQFVDPSPEAGAVDRDPEFGRRSRHRGARFTSL
jgi:hypothetical protein